MKIHFITLALLSLVLAACDRPRNPAIFKSLFGSKDSAEQSLKKQQASRKAAVSQGSQCVYSHEECNSYSLECSSYSEVCTQYEDVCTNYESVCQEYNSYCDAYDDNGDCISYTDECISYANECTDYSATCVASETQCNSYQEVCDSYSTVCDEEIYDPSFISSSRISKDSIELNWEYTGNTSRISYIAGFSAPTEYCITDPSISENVIGYQNTFEIGNLNPDTTYTFRVCTVDASGNYSSPGITYTATTKPLLADPTTVSTYYVADTVVGLQWAENGHLSRISYKKGEVPPGIFCNSTPQVSEEEVGYDPFSSIYGLEPNTTYSFRICTVSDDGLEVSAGTTINVTTRRLIPPSPVIVRVDTVDKYSVSLAWENTGPNYRIAYADGSEDPGPYCPSGFAVTDSQEGGLVHYTIRGLLPRELYRIRICSANIDGDASYGTVVTATTLAEPPAPAPSFLTVTPGLLSTINLSWGFTSGAFPVRLIYKLGTSVPTSCSDGTAIAFQSVVSTYTLGGLKPDTAVAFRICSLNLNSSPDLTAGPGVTSHSGQLGFVDNRIYLGQSPDVAAAIDRGDYTSPSDYYMNNGYREPKRFVSILFDEEYYREKYPDVAQAIQRNEQPSGFLHYINYGQVEDRSPSIYFDPTYYRAHNPGADQEVRDGLFQTLPLQFFYKGLSERKRGSTLYDENYYLTQNPDVVEAIAHGTYTTGLEHYILIGKAEGRRAFAAHETIPLYRAYNPNADYHFFATSLPEYNNAVAHGYQAEGIAFQVYRSKDDANLTALLRLYNPNNGRHYYTLNSIERDYLVSLGWRFEREEGFLYQTQMAGTQEVFRLYNRTTGVHLYTIHPEEKDYTLQHLSQSWEQHSSLGFTIP